MYATLSFPRLIVCSVIGAAAALGGCVSTPVPIEPLAIEPARQTSEAATEFVPVVRYNRYTLVELAPTAAQRDLLLQTVDASIPGDVHATVGDGLRHVLKRSGYQLCKKTHPVADLYVLPLPAAHLHLGPMTLRDALLTLAGPAWELHSDDGKRQICFERVGGVTPAIPTPEPTVTEAARSFPLTGDQP